MSDGDFKLWIGRLGRQRSMPERLLTVQRLRSAARRTGGRRGRGGSVARLLATGAPASRRVVVRACYVRSRVPKQTAIHLRYLERDGTLRDGGRSRLYGPEGDEADGRPFIGRASRDRHQFRFIVAPEDAAEYGDLKSLTRQLMAQMARDLRTPLDWVAVDHFNTNHPHTHVVVRGIDATGRDLIIARDYLAYGVRERAAEILTRDLGPKREFEVVRELGRGIDRSPFADLMPGEGLRRGRKPPGLER